jgi:hypothetical protein
LLAPEDFESVSELNRLSQLFWSCFTPIVANIIAPVFAHRPSGIALVQSEAAWTGRDLARALECQECAGQRKTSEQLYEQEFLHNWPFFVSHTLAICGRKWFDWRNKTDRGYRNCIAPMGVPRGLGMAVRGGWHVVMGENRLQTLPSWPPLARKFLPAYLQDLATRDFQLQKRKADTTWLGEVIHDVAGYVRRVGGNPKPVLAARERIWPDVDPGHALALAHLMRQLVRSGRLVISLQGFERRDKRPALARTPQGLFVPEGPLRSLLLADEVLLPGHTEVSRLLSAGGALAGDREDGWFLDEPWWLASQESGQHCLPVVPSL